MKGAADLGPLAHSGRREGGVWSAGQPSVADVGMTLQQPEARPVLPGKLSLDHAILAVVSCTGSWEGRCG